MTVKRSSITLLLSSVRLQYNDIGEIVLHVMVQRQKLNDNNGTLALFLTRRRLSFVPRVVPDSLF